MAAGLTRSQLTGAMSESPERSSKRRKRDHATISPVAPSTESSNVWSGTFVPLTTDDSVDQLSVPSTWFLPADNTDWTPPAHANADFEMLLALPDDLRQYDNTQGSSTSGNSTSERPGQNSPAALPYAFQQNPFADVPEHGRYVVRIYDRPVELNGYVKASPAPQDDPGASSRPAKRTRLSRDDTTGPGLVFPRETELISNAAFPGPIFAMNSPEDSMTMVHSMSPSDLAAAPMYDGILAIHQPRRSSPVASSIDPTSLSSRSLITSSHALSDWTPGSPPRQLSHATNSVVSMNRQGLRLWNFYTNNFVPGRSVMRKSNLWYEFAGLLQLPSVVSAIQSYMAVYVFDYTQSLTVQRRLNTEFRSSANRVEQLLRSRHRTSNEDAELVTVLIILGQQDIALLERRDKLPHKPRWLKAFLAAEHIINQRDPGSRHWRGQEPPASYTEEERWSNNVQMVDLLVAQTIMVGRALITAQTMDELDAAVSRDPETYSKRFGWLMYGPVDAIQGGCGCSKRLLHCISQITWFTAGLASDQLAVHGSFLLRKLKSLRQHNPESKNSSIDNAAQPIVGIRSRPRGYKISLRDEMIEVTAEAWRIAAILYLQCRMLRLPRNHPEVIASVDDLAHCVRIMPTSGFIFTAQAPLMPVFFLGVLATSAEHKDACASWMTEVVQSSIRSSVPPLWIALQNIWRWIAKDPRATPRNPENAATSITSRDAWWEHLVAKVQRDESEILCLT